ncbi:MAG TPA: hypothetical protein VGQ30_04225 [Gemmatimonadaceae bacterium]|nr:hypothetical protein [Gemmatimonadaceae bacterium]
MIVGSVTGSMMPVRERIAIAARAIEPILNRVVLAGPPVVDLLLTNPTIRTQDLTFAADSTLQLLSTSMVDRLGADLQKLGFTRIGRAATADRWRIADDVAIDLVQVHADDMDPDRIWLEYATLLTLPCSLDGLTFRIVGAPAMLALECAAFATSGARAVDSEEVERIVQIVAARSEIEAECSAAPPEVRTIISESLARLARNDALSLIAQRALPDAAILPELARRIRERMLRMSC